MDWGWQGAVTAASVAAVLWTARLFDDRLAGLLAGLPLISGPALVWLAHDHGAGFAGHSAAGIVVTATVAPVFAGLLAALAVRMRLWGALGVATTLAVGLAAVLRLLGDATSAAPPGFALALAGAVAWSVRRKLHRAAVATEPPQAPARRTRELWLTVWLAGAMSALMGLAAPLLGGFWAGAASSLPLVSACVLLSLGRRGATAQMHQFAAAYAPGAWGTATFACVFGLAVPALGALVATPLALAATLLAVAAFRRVCDSFDVPAMAVWRGVERRLQPQRPGQVFRFGERRAVCDLMRAQPVEHRP